MNAPGLDAQVESALAALSRAAEHPWPSAARRRLFAEHLRGVYAVGLALAADPSLAGTPPLARLAEAVRRITHDDLRDVEDYLGDLSTGLTATARAEGWQGVARRRSAAELFAELLDDPEQLERVRADLRSVDGQIREVAEYKGHLLPDEVPPEIPRTHWWWWAPNPPPA